MKIPRKILFALSDPLEIIPAPYAAMAAKAETTEKALLRTIQRGIHAGLIKRMGVVLGHHQAGYTANAMVAWKVPATRMISIGKCFAEFEAVTHCYERQTYPQWPYNLYTMVHAKTPGECLHVIAQMKNKSKIKDNQVLVTTKEFKKTKSSIREIFA